MKFHVDTYYRFEKRKTGVCLGMTIEADDIDEAIDKAKAECIGPRWPKRIYAGSKATHADESAIVRVPIIGTVNEGER